MSEPEDRVLSPDELVAWRGYFQAAISGLLAAGELDPRTAAVPRVIAEACSRVADAAMSEENKPRSIDPPR